MSTSRSRRTPAKSNGCSRRARAPAPTALTPFADLHRSATHPSGDEAASGCARSPRCAGQACVQRIPPEAGPHARRHPRPQRGLLVDQVLALRASAASELVARRARQARAASPGRGRAALRRAPAGRRDRRRSGAGRRTRTSATRARSRRSSPSCAARSAAGRSRAWATGSCTAGRRSRARCSSTTRCWPGSRRSSRSRRCTSRTTSRPIRLLRELEPGLPQVACFDTAFHRTLPPVAERFALPEELHAAGLRRYGFHGLSYEYVAAALPTLDPAAAQRPHRRDAPRQRREHVRAARRPERRDDHGLQRARRPLHGDALRRARPRRRALARERARPRPARHRARSSTTAPGLLGVSGHLERHAHAARLARPPRAARGGPVRLPDRPRARLARGGARRGSTRVVFTGRHRRERGRRSASACAATRPGSASSSTPAANAAGGPRISAERSRVVGVGGPHRRGADDRAARAPRARRDAPHAGGERRVTAKTIEPRGQPRRCPPSGRRARR